MAKRIAISEQKKILFEWVDYNEISPNILKAVISSEDSNFFYHQGFEWDAIKKALHQNIREKKIVSGGSTITQQLSKNLFLTSQKNLLRKLQEAVVTVNIELFLEKKRILEIYLNVIEWGDGIYGVEAASNYYFSLRARNLSKIQAARLAVILPNPKLYQKMINSPYVKKKTQLVMDRMKHVNLP